MDIVSSRLRLIALFLICLPLLLVSSVSAHEEGPQAVFAEQIIDDIEELEDATKDSDLPDQLADLLDNRLDICEYHMEEGVDELEDNNETEAVEHFKKALNQINQYLKLISDKVLEGKIDENDAAPLIVDAKDIRTRIRQLIRDTSSNDAPVANAGPDQNVLTGQMVTLDGSNSFDPDDDDLQFLWSVSSEPVGSGVGLNDNQSATPSFTPIVPGTYIFDLVVSDAISSSALDSVTINVSTTNTQPLADAGPDQTGTVGDTITLDGSGSSDADGDPLTYSWVLSTKPGGSSATLSAPTSIMPTFVADEDGLYEAELTVNDGTISSLVDTVAIQIDNKNTRPIADAGPDQSVTTGELVLLDGSGSSDADGDSLIWFWALVSKPVGSTAVINDVVLVQPSFTADLVGQYVAQLVVNDGLDESDPDSVIINAVTPNTIPIADAGPDQSDVVGSLITLDGSASADADNDPLSFNWSLLSTPAGSSASLDNPAIVNPSFVLDLSLIHI